MQAKDKPSQPSDKETIHGDAAGQFANVKEGGKSNGVASAKPTVITGSDDGTAHKVPPGQPGPKREWDSNFDERESNTGDFRG